MIRNTLFGLSLLAFSAGSALAAAPAVKSHKARVHAMAETAPAGDTGAPADKAETPKKAPKKHGGKKADKSTEKSMDKPEGSKEVKAAPEKAVEKAPATK